MRVTVTAIDTARAHGRKVASLNVRLDDVGATIEGIWLKRGTAGLYLDLPRRHAVLRDGSLKLDDRGQPITVRVIAFDPEPWAAFNSAVLAAARLARPEMFADEGPQREAAACA